MSPKGALLLIAGKADKAEPDEKESDKETTDEGDVSPEQDAAMDAVKAIKAGDADAADLLIQTIKACMSADYDKESA